MDSPGARSPESRAAGRVIETRDLVVGLAGRGRSPGFRLRVGSFALARGEIAVLSGANGTGKTTTLSCLAGILAPVAGRVLVEGESLYGALGSRTGLRRKIAFVAADPYLFRGNVLDNVVYGLQSRKMGRSEALRMGLDALEQAGLAGLAHKRARSLSRGQVRRVAVIRAVILEPDVLLLDEPDGDLDVAGRRWLLETIEEISARAAVLVTSHLSGDLVGMAHRVLSVNGSVLSRGAEEE